MKRHIVLSWKRRWKNEYQYEHLMVYYTFRYFMRAFYDNNLLEKAQFAVASFLMVRDMDVMVWMKNGQKFDLQDRIETTKGLRKRSGTFGRKY